MYQLPVCRQTPGTDGLCVCAVKCLGEMGKWDDENDDVISKH